MALFGSLALVACHGTGPHNHAHEEHDPAVETHLHEHETPEEHEAHGHEAETGHGHAGEISLPAEKARAAGVVVDTVVRGPFREVIVASGRILPAPGDEKTVVASVPGVVALPGTLTEGAQVNEGGTLLHISSAHLQDGDPVERARIAYEAARPPTSAPANWSATGSSPRRSSKPHAPTTKPPAWPTKPSAVTATTAARPSARPCAGT